MCKVLESGFNLLLEAILVSLLNGMLNKNNANQKENNQSFHLFVKLVTMVQRCTLFVIVLD